MTSQAPADSITVTLQSQQTDEDANSVLSSLVRRIAVERDGLRNVNERILEEEIARSESSVGAEHIVGQSEDEERPKDFQTQQKELLTARTDMLRFVDESRNQAAMCLDLLSFQLKDEVPKAAMQTLSPFMKQNYPQGGLGLDKLKPTTKDQQDVDDDNLTSLGWSLKSLNNSADLLLSSAKKLNEEVEKETRYWRGISEVKKRGWSICRVPRQRNLVGVKFGFSEAGPLFQQQSLAPLRADDDGNIILDSGLTHQRKRMRVRVNEAGRTVGDSRVDASASIDTDLENRIRQASDSLFEDELFHEMTCEARDLLAYNVRIVNDAIHIPLPFNHPRMERHLAFSLDSGLQLGQVRLTASANQYDSEASAFALATRILLTNVHRERFMRRLSPPPPLSDEKKDHSTSRILRPLMNYVLHRGAVETLDSFGADLSKMFISAGVEFSCKAKQSIQLLTSNETPMDNLIASFAAPYSTYHRFSLGSTASGGSATSLAVHTVTNVSEPEFGTSFRVVLDSTSREHPDTRRTILVPDREAVVAHITRQLSVALARHVVRQHPDWSQGDPAVPKIHTVRDIRDGSDIREEQQQTLGIHIKDGRLVLVHEAPGKSPMIRGAWPSPGSCQNFDDVLTSL